MRITKNRLRYNVRELLKEFLFTSFLPDEGDEDNDERSFAQRIGGKHTARIDYSEADESEVENEDLEENET